MRLAEVQHEAVVAGEALAALAADVGTGVTLALVRQVRGGLPVRSHVSI